MATKTAKTKGAAQASKPTPASLEKHVAAVAEQAPIPEFKGEIPDPGEAIPAPPVADPAEVPAPPGYNPTDIPNHLAVLVDRAHTFLAGQIAQHLSKDQYAEFLAAFKKSL